MLFSKRAITRSAMVGLTIVAVLLCCNRETLADTPTTAPADTSAAIQSSLQQLSDRDPSVRDAARERLMGLSSADLPALRAAVEQLRPLPPGDADALREIVKHVYLAGENSDVDVERGFMGVMMRDDYQSVFADSDDADSGLPLGVVVDVRLPGFAAYRALRDGDIILAIAADGIEAIRVHSIADITGTVAKLAPGQRVQLQVLRNGRRIETTITLDARPRELAPGQAPFTFDRYRQAQEDKAQAFWIARFAPVVDDSIS